MRGGGGGHLHRCGGAAGKRGQYPSAVMGIGAGGDQPILRSGPARCAVRSVPPRGAGGRAAVGARSSSTGACRRIDAGGLFVSAARLTAARCRETASDAASGGPIARSSATKARRRAAVRRCSPACSRSRPRFQEATASREGGARAIPQPGASRPPAQVRSASAAHSASSMNSQAITSQPSGPGARSLRKQRLPAAKRARVRPTWWSAATA